MELPIALDVTLKALLSCHSVQSWKIATEGQNPTVILRLRPETQKRACQDGAHSIDTVAFKRKPPSQIQRDRRRAEEFYNYRQRRDHVENTTVLESRAATQSETTAENELNTKTIEKDTSENQNKQCDSVSGHTSRDSATVTPEHAARGGDDERLTAARDESGGSGSEMETDSESDTRSDTKSDTETKVTETESEQSIRDVARDFVENAKRFRYEPEHLRQEDEHNSFSRVKLDWRCREDPQLLCISQYVIATCGTITGETNFQLREPSIYLPFWDSWPEVNRGGVHKERIDKLWTKKKEIFNRFWEMYYT